MQLYNEASNACFGIAAITQISAWSSKLATSNTTYNSKMFSLHFNGHFPDGWYQNVSILDFTGAKGDGSGGNNWSYKDVKAPVKMSPQINHTQLVFTGRMPFISPNQQCQSTERKKLRYYTHSNLDTLIVLSSEALTTRQLSACRHLLMTIHQQHYSHCQPRWCQRIKYCWYIQVKSIYNISPILFPGLQFWYFNNDTLSMSKKKVKQKISCLF